MLFSRSAPNDALLYTVWLGLLIIGWSCTGCAPAGPKRQAVSGAVTLDGKPATGLTVVFTPTGSDQVGAAVEVVAGKFSLDATHGPSEGEHDVTVDTIEPDLEDFEQLRQAGKKPFSSIALPPRYRKPGALHASVIAEKENIFNFELRSR